MASMTMIPQDIITTHILCHLPAKSVGRLRCVSKEWLSLLSEPQFIETHQKTLNINRFVFDSKDGSLYSVPYNYHEAVPTLTKLPLELHNFCIDGTVNGLVLASGYKNMDYKDYTRIVINLTTKDYVELPTSSPKKYFGVKGFGYDSVSDDYKVVVFSRFKNYYGNVYVYNLRTNTWKQVISHSRYRDYRFSRLSGVSVNGFLHWILGSDSKSVIVAFSLADEKLSELPPPNLYNEDINFALSETNLVALGEKLAIFDELKGAVWLMNEYGVQESWTKILVNRINEIPMHAPIVFYENGKVMCLTSDLLGIYDVEEQTFCKSFDISSMRIRFYIGDYAESLVSPKFSRSK